MDGVRSRLTHTGVRKIYTPARLRNVTLARYIICGFFTVRPPFCFGYYICDIDGRTVLIKARDNDAEN